MNQVFGKRSNSSSDDEEVVEEKKSKMEAKSKKNKDEEKQLNVIPDVKDSLNEYFKLKRTYENKIMINKKKIINNSTLSNREKHSEYLKLKPKCINCQRPGGTIFKITGFKESDTEEAYRQYNAQCGIIADPCNLDIKIQIGKYELFTEILDNLQNEIKNTKNQIIDDKNKLLFGYLTSNEVLEKFEDLKETISNYSSLYEIYLRDYNNIVDNEKEKSELQEAITESYIQIQEVKNCIKKMNETNNLQYAHDAATIYTTIIQPLFNKIRTLKYNETMVWNEDNSNTCNLIQTQYSISNLTHTSFQNKVIAYNVGLRAMPKKKPGLIIESESDEPTKPNKLIKGVKDSVINAEPQNIDGSIIWNNNKYQEKWNIMPEKLKNALMTDNDWMNAFMFNLINQKDKNYGYTFIEPPKLKIPPQELSNGEYDFGVKIYNDEFKNLPSNLQKTYKTFYSVKDGIKNYIMLKNAMNDLVSKSVGFNKGFF